MCYLKIMHASNSSLTIGNNYCPAGPLYRDTFILSINNFSSDKNGYYWCQIYASQEQTTSHGGQTNSPLDEQSQVMSMVIVLYIIIGVLVLIILLLLLVILAFIVHTTRNRKTFKLQQRE